MTLHPGSSPRRSRWRWYTAVALAIVAQLAFNLLPLIDGWHGVGAGPHIEAVGGTAHYAHAEETCTACHGHVLDAHPTSVVHLAIGYDQVRSTPARAGAFAPHAVLTSSHRSRAPPTTS